MTDGTKYRLNTDLMIKENYLLTLNSVIKFVDEKPKRDQRDLNRAINCLCCALTTQKIRGFPPPGTITTPFYFFILDVKIIEADRIISMF